MHNRMPKRRQRKFFGFMKEAEQYFWLVGMVIGQEFSGFSGGGHPWLWTDRGCVKPQQWTHYQFGGVSFMPLFRGFAVVVGLGLHCGHMWYLANGLLGSRSLSIYLHIYSWCRVRSKGEMWFICLIFILIHIHIILSPTASFLLAPPVYVVVSSGCPLSQSLWVQANISTWK